MENILLRKKKMPLIVNLYGAPGSGKSTTRAGTFNLLKLSKVNVEEVTEYAKDLVWEERYNALHCQPYVYGKQLRNIERLMQKVDVIITDSPLVLSAFYCDDSKYNLNFKKFVMEHDKTFNSLNIFLTRTKEYSKIGRMQTEGESDEVSIKLKNFLQIYNIEIHAHLNGDEFASKLIHDNVVRILKDGI